VQEAEKTNSCFNYQRLLKIAVIAFYVILILSMRYFIPLKNEFITVSLSLSPSNSPLRMLLQETTPKALQPITRALSQWFLPLPSKRWGDHDNCGENLGVAGQ
jgi:hypothetical protein